MMSGWVTARLSLQAWSDLPPKVFRSEVEALNARPPSRTPREGERMSFYIRKSVRVGPLRFNLSKSGIGVSAGVPGFRVGMGPRGNYVHAGRGGLYYRATLPSPSRNPTTLKSLPLGPHRTVVPSLDPTMAPAEEIESGSVTMMKDDSAADLLAELNEKRRRWRIAPIIAVVGVITILLAWRSLLPIGQVAVFVAVCVAVASAYESDVLRKSTVIMYDLESDAIGSYQRLVSAIQGFAQANKLWHVQSRAEVLDRKYHAGAQSEITRSPTSIRMGSPQYVKCNIDVPAINVGRQTLYFFPDRLLVFDSESVGAVGYAALAVERLPTRFIEADSVPLDAKVVDRTWRFVNKKGGPDRRFKDNRELPICEYEAIHFGSDTGLNELLHASRAGVADELLRYLSAEYGSPGR
jgi:hypothetical protein